MSSTEDSIIRRIDQQRSGISQAEMIEHGRKAEKIITQFLGTISGLEVRPATKIEDSGKLGIVKDLAIDAVGYIDGKPAIGFQITIANDKGVRQEKAADLMNRPFIRLSEMNNTDTAIPRTLVFVDHEEMRRFLMDNDKSKHPKIMEQIKESVMNSLRLVLMKTKNAKEQELIQSLMILFSRTRT